MVQRLRLAAVTAGVTLPARPVVQQIVKPFALEQLERLGARYVVEIAQDDDSGLRVASQ